MRLRLLQEVDAANGFWRWGSAAAVTLRLIDRVGLAFKLRQRPYRRQRVGVGTETVSASVEPCRQGERTWDGSRPVDRVDHPADSRHANTVLPELCRERQPFTGCFLPKLNGRTAFRLRPPFIKFGGRRGPGVGLARTGFRVDFQAWNPF